jgi:hypothetical protein
MIVDDEDGETREVRKIGCISHEGLLTGKSEA